MTNDACAGLDRRGDPAARDASPAADRNRGMGHDPFGGLTLATGDVVISTTAVDLMGRLSNPPDPVETLTGQGIAGSGDLLGKRSKTSKRLLSSSESGGPENKGRLSNPQGQTVQRRLADAEVNELVTRYRAGQSLPELADDFGVHRRTVAARLEQRGVHRRVNVRKMSDEDIHEAERRYRAGDSLVTVGDALGVHSATVRRELARAGVTIRPRPGF